MMVSRIMSAIAVLSIGPLSACLQGVDPLYDDGAYYESYEDVEMVDDFAALGAQSELVADVSDESQDFSIQQIFKYISSFDCVTVRSHRRNKVIRVVVKYKERPGTQWLHKETAWIYYGDRITICVPDSHKIKAKIKAARRRQFSIEFHDE